MKFIASLFLGALAFLFPHHQAVTVQTVTTGTAPVQTVVATTSQPTTITKVIYQVVQAPIPATTPTPVVQVPMPVATAPATPVVEATPVDPISAQVGLVTSNFSSTRHQGTYDVSFRITAGDKDLYIPDSVGLDSGDGIEVYLTGSQFSPSGTMNATLSCPNVIQASEPLCKVHAGTAVTFKVHAVGTDSGGTHGFVVSTIRYATNPSPEGLLFDYSASGIESDSLDYETPNTFPG